MKKDILILIGLIVSIAIVLMIIVELLNKPSINNPSQNINNMNEQQNTMNENNNLVIADQAIIKTNMGNITVKFYGQDSPNTVSNFVKLASQGFYDGIRFHRIIKDFMVQAGDPLTKDESTKDRWGTGGPGYKFADEFNNHLLVRGSLAMANAGPNTNGSQFFIVTAEETPWLDGKHTNFGEVINGMDVLAAMNNVETEGPDRPVNDVIINSIEILQ